MFCGIDDSEFIRGKVPMTKQEIRIITLTKARIAPSDVVYDIGAGTGSISIEAARIAHEGRVFAIEKNPDGVSLIKENMKKFQVDNVEVVSGVAPDALDGLPGCDAVIIGGSGRNMDDILDIVHDRLKLGGRVVLNCITIQTISSCLEYLRAHPDEFDYEAIQVQVNRLKAVGPYDMADAVNPIYIVTATKKG
ncbi:MAG: precorrin-6Y C5,15-methyltransferase (decarboxylating) subunit CbiT [Selenomonadaceae bacterium]|nr:precorrin-6Y C5,15-methyltransferase (decarboxylating) subunit CbiT [Selenomonadaceae bacterium]